MTITLEVAIAAVGAAIAIFGGAIGTGMAQSSIGASGIGLIAEKPEETGKALLFLVLPETIIVFSFVIAILIMHAAGSI